LINYFKKIEVEDFMFFYTFDVDEKNLLTHFLLKDEKIFSDYNCFEDVVVF
jgi:hypothetical protein